MATTIGLVVGDSGVPTAGDTGLRSRIESLGFTVTYVDDSAAVPAGMQGFVIAASSVAATVGTKYDTVALPVVTANHDLWDDNRLSADVGAATASSADYDLETHAITTGMADPLTILSSAQAQRGVLNASVAAGATIFARPGADSARASGWAVGTGGTLTSGTAPARRVALFLPDAWLALLTANGQLLVQQALSWAFRTITVTYDTQLSRVRITVVGLGSADTALVERSTDQITWTTVRGGVSAPVTNGSVSLDDYEFAANVVNYYRATSAVDGVFVASGAASHGDNVNQTPALPAGILPGDLLLIHTACRNLAVGPGTPSGYTRVGFPTTNVAVFAKTAGSSESAPTVTYSGSAGDTTSAQMAAVRNVSLTQVNAQSGNNPAQNIAYPALTVPYTHPLLIYAAWKEDDWTSVATLAGDGGTGVEIGDLPTILGNDQGLVWDYVLQNTTAPTNITAGSFVVTGGTSVTSRGAVIAFAPNTLVQTTSITPTLSGVWLKSVSRPFLNMQVAPLKGVKVSRPARNGIFDIVGRSDPVSVSDVRGSRELTVGLIWDDETERTLLDLMLASGDPLFLHVPPGSPVPSMYIAAGDSEDDYERGVVTFLVKQVAAPGPDIVGATITWQGVINAYATWSALIAAEATWQDLLENIGDPADVMVP